MEPDIPEDVIQSIEDDVRELIHGLTSYEPNTDNFNRCTEFTMYNILCQKHSIPSETSTRESLDTFIARYDCEGFPKFAGIFEDNLRGYLETGANDKKSQKVKWNVLECLVQLSHDAFKTDVLKNLESRLNASDGMNLSDEIRDEEKIDWHAYLQEGSEKYRLPPDDSDEDSCYAEEETLTAEPTRKEDLIAAPIYNDLFAHFPQDPVCVPGQNMVLKKILEDEPKTKQWLAKKFQNTWWKGEMRQVDVNEHPALCFGLRWDDKFHSGSSQFLSEYKIIRELLWVFVNSDENTRNKRIEYLRRKVTVSSLTQSVTESVVNEILDSAARYFHLRAFYEEVLSGSNVFKLSFTFRAYAAAVRDMCCTMLQKIIDEENIVKRQEETYTLMTLRSNLQPYLSDINFLYTVHDDCVLSSWREKESWLRIIRLLSTVFFKLQDTASSRNRTILLKIFFRTFKVYADMIDGWLRENKLFDWRNEFFIRKNEEGSWYSLLPIDNGPGPEEVVVAPFFTRMSKCLLNCSQNVEFLCKLNKMQCVTLEILKNGSLMDCIIHEFQQRLHQHTDACLDISSSSIEPNNDEEMSEIFESCDIEEELAANMYLIQAYSDIRQAKDLMQLKLPSDRFGENENDKDLSVNITDLDLLPVATALEQTICAQIEKKEDVIAKFFELAIVDSYKFFDHVRTLTGLLLIDMRSICTQMNATMDKKTWGGNHALQILLCDCVQRSKLPFGELVHFVYDKDAVISDRHTKVCVFETIRSVDCITLQYTTQWPMSKLFSDEVIKSVYDPLFKLVLKINIAFYSVTRLRFSDLPDTRVWRRKLRKMEVFRHWVALLLQKLRSYMMLIVPQCLGDKLIESVTDINNFTKLQESYLAYLKKAKSKCLIDSKMLEYLNRALERLWRVCDDVRDLWTKATSLHFNEPDIARSVELYVQCVWYLSQILKKFLKEKRKDDPMYNLWSEIHHMVKVHEQSIPEDLSFKSSQSTLI